MLAKTRRDMRSNGWLNREHLRDLGAINRVCRMVCTPFCNGATRGEAGLAKNVSSIPSGNPKMREKRE
jgi:hypothetical protein